MEFRGPLAELRGDASHEFAAMLRRLRLVAGLSQEALAERARVSVRAISDLERGQRRAPHPATIARLADALELDAEPRAALLLAAASPSRIDAAGEAARPSAPPTEAPSIEAPRAPSHRQERRWVTVLAVEIGGFAQLAQRIDPEDLRTLVDAWVAHTSVHIRGLDGTVVGSTDRSILAVFGAPVAHEDDAQRAIRAGLAIVASGHCPRPSVPAYRPRCESGSKPARSWRVSPSGSHTANTWSAVPA